ncbi:MAG: 4-alpha-glucanotransferase, partial [Nocardioidaceae bacterium]
MTSPSSPAPELVELARSYDVATDYHDWQGRPVDVPEQTIAVVLGAMGVDVADPAAALRARTGERWRRMLPPCVVVRAGEERTVWVHVEHGAPADVAVDLEDGDRRHLRQLDQWVEPQQVDGRLVGEATFAVPTDLPLGYHTLRARSGDEEATAALIVTPSWLGLPERLGRQRSWGFAAQLYSVRSRRSWGVGDLTDLTDLAVWSGARLGADYLLVNPLHAAEPTAPMEPSPYLPTSRRFFNPLYLRVERIPEYVDMPPAARAEAERVAARVHEALDAADTI